jgi:hypothetical protein
MVAPADAIDIHADTFDFAARKAGEKAQSMSHSKETPMKQLIIATAAAFLLGAPLALAASNGTTTLTPNAKPTTHRVVAANLSEQCTALGQQFDKAEATHKNAKNYKEALGLRSEGKTLCSAHKEADGVKKIESALAMIGVKPMVKS